MKIGIYPGTFDPVTRGHLDIIIRAGRLFDRIIVAVAPNERKGPLFSIDERVDMLKVVTRDLDRVDIYPFDGLLVDFARNMGATALIRGLRAVSDFDFEFQMTQMNRDLDPDLETIFLMPTQDYFFTSSTTVKQVARFDPERVEKFVPLSVAAALKKRFGHD